MMTIPVGAAPAQSLAVTLGGQNCKINVYQKGALVFLDLFVDGEPIIQTAICRDRVNLVRQGYLGFIGGLVFCDTQGVSDPDYSGFGDRFLLIYLEASDL